MKILWLVNILLPELSEHLGRPPSVFGGWLTGAMQGIREAGHQLVICTTGSPVGRYEVRGLTYYIVPDDSAEMRAVLDREKPDVVHIYGTEFPQALSMTRAADPESLLVTIQGAMTYLQTAVYAGISEKICRDTWLHKLLRRFHKGGQSIELQKKSFQKRAAIEREVLTRAKYINGGSHWGDVVARSVNPNCTVMSCGLVLRPEFYTELRWDLAVCEKHSIYTLFSYPIKGFHMFLEALRLVVAEYPNTKVYVVSNKLPYRRYTGLKKRIMDLAPDYNWYVQGIVEAYGLQKHLVFLGSLSAKQVRERMLRSHVFVSASSIENQSTSLGEAMILGVPCIASCVGAVQEYIEDGRNGFLYPFSEPYLLADKITTLFANDELAKQFSENGRARSKSAYDPDQNIQTLLGVYRTIIEKAGE